MTTVSYTNLRDNLENFLDTTEQETEPIIIDRGEKNGKKRRSVILSFDEYTGIMETLYLLSSPKNKEHLERSIEQRRLGQVIHVSL